MFVLLSEIRPPVLNNTNMAGVSTLTAPGSLQEFFCYADGVPFPSITWTKDGEEFDVSNMSGVEITEEGQRLTIRRVLERDAGFYECVVENRGGMVKVNSTLDILMGKECFLIIVEVVDSSSLAIICISWKNF
ncbi:hypothetical protein AVEN_256623-1 [Araneus ventricosus]|uniref:Ig-like domain-containing protein n=1 Tax=Araneus ventricosus TaxID=182803 RepID=A0A4Y2NGW7_ARAVE|nr:hypothetical protein AVEN_256623-1 [Araneus ventricosus]